MQNKPKCNFYKKAHSLGQTYVCPGLIKPSLGTDICTCVPRNLSALGINGSVLVPLVPLVPHSLCHWVSLHSSAPLVRHIQFLVSLTLCVGSPRYPCYHCYHTGCASGSLCIRVLYYAVKIPLRLEDP